VEVEGLVRGAAIVGVRFAMATGCLRLGGDVGGGNGGMVQVAGVDVEAQNAAGQSVVGYHARAATTAIQPLHLLHRASLRLPPASHPPYSRPHPHPPPIQGHSNPPIPVFHAVHTFADCWAAQPNQGSAHPVPASHGTIAFRGNRKS